MLVAVALGIASPHAGAQTILPAPQPKSTPADAPAQTEATPEDLQTLLQILRDPAKRDELAKQIETLLKVQQPETVPEEERGLGVRVLGALSAGFQQFSQFMEELGRSFGASGHLLAWLENQGSDPTLRAMWLDIGQDLALSLGAGLIVAYLIGIGVKAGRRRLAHRAGSGLFRRIRFAAVRLILELLPIIAFGLVALAVAGWAAPIPTARLALLAIINAALVSMAGAVIARFLFSPMEPGLRLFPLSDSTAVYLYIWSRRLIVVGVWGYVLLETALLLGLPRPGYVVAAKILGLILTGLLIVLALQNREAVARWIRGQPPVEGGRRIVPGAARNRIAEVWHVAVIAYLAGGYLVWAFEISGGFFYLLRATAITALVIGAVAAGEYWLPRLFNRFSGLDASLMARYPLVAARANRYVPIFRRVVVYAVRIAACLLILAAWRVDVGGILFGAVGRNILSRLADIAIVLVLSLAAWEILGGIIYARLNQRDDSGYSMLRSARARTLLPLVRNILLIVISVMASLIILSEIGVDIAPLLAGAGVVGLAIGFGAQSLVKDVIAGAFMLFEDTINIGDVVDIGGQSGVVEGMTIRSIRLRDQAGAVHTMTYGNIATVINMTRDYSYYVVDAKVSYRYDPDEVAMVLRQTDEEMRADAKFKHDLLMPIEIMGLETFADTSFIVRARLRTRPMRQWDVGREFNRRLKHNMDQNGIVLAVPAAPPFASPPDQQEPQRKRAGSRPN
ncbi:MAG TPA: mechanosensitive ion channel domain-containing protein [Dongiaceae bacterium]|nr:mechanosensitive ion channel domain-containing protein [Dongiaceae bacterium]